MSIAHLTRTVIVTAYLVGLLLNGRADLASGGIAAALVAVWAAPLLRDGMARRTRVLQRAPASAARSSLG
jgi:hypothetical protein